MNNSFKYKIKENRFENNGIPSFDLISYSDRSCDLSIDDDRFFIGYDEIEKMKIHIGITKKANDFLSSGVYKIKNDDQGISSLASVIASELRRYVRDYKIVKKPEIAK